MGTAAQHPLDRRLSLILADDHRMTVEAFSATLGCDYDIAGVAFDGDELLTLVQRCAADCLLLDLILPGRNGLELIPRVRSLQPAMKILVVTMLIDRPLAEAALSTGASGFVPKDAGIAELKLAIGEVLAGRRYVSPRLPKTSHRVSLEARHPALRALTPRQQEIVLLLGEGKSDREIAYALALSPSTITFHKHHLMRVLGFESDGALMKYAILLRAGAESAQAPHRA